MPTTPVQWLKNKLEESEKSDLVSMIYNMVDATDNDSVERVFREAMENDGFYSNDPISFNMRLTDHEFELSQGNARRRTANVTITVDDRRKGTSTTDIHLEDMSRQDVYQLCVLFENHIPNARFPVAKSKEDPYRLALDIQNASNLSGVLSSLGPFIERLISDYNAESAKIKSTASAATLPGISSWLRENPALRLYLNKILDLIGTYAITGTESFGASYAACRHKLGEITPEMVEKAAETE